MLEYICSWLHSSVRLYEINLLVQRLTAATDEVRQWTQRMLFKRCIKLMHLCFIYEPFNLQSLHKLNCLKLLFNVSHNLRVIILEQSMNYCILRYEALIMEHSSTTIFLTWQHFNLEWSRLKITNIFITKNHPRWRVVTWITCKWQNDLI